MTQHLPPTKKTIKSNNVDKTPADFSRWGGVRPSNHQGLPDFGLQRLREFEEIVTKARSGDSPMSSVVMN